MEHEAGDGHRVALRIAGAGLPLPWAGPSHRDGLIYPRSEQGRKGCGKPGRSAVIPAQASRIAWESMTGISCGPVAGYTAVPSGISGRRLP